MEDEARVPLLHRRARRDADRRPENARQPRAVLQQLDLPQRDLALAAEQALPR